MEHDRSKPPTDAELIQAGIDDWLLQGMEGAIDDTTARIIASQDHEGQGSALYSLASTGAIDIDALIPEMKRSYLEGRATGDGPRMRALEMLGVYVAVNGDREPVEGWHEQTKW